MSEPLNTPDAERRASIRELLPSAHRPILLAVAGDSGSGKTTYTDGIRRLLGSDVVASISLDGYHKEDRAQRRLSGRLPLDPKANHLRQARADLNALRAGQTVDIPVYDHVSGRFAEPRRVEPAPVIVVEGLHALYPELQKLMDFTLYVDSDREVKWRWKFQRDVHVRGYRPDEVKRDMQRREVAYKRWIDFQKTHADVIVKIHESELASLAVEEYEGRLPDDCHHMEVIVTPTAVPLPALYLPVDLNGMTKQDALPFMLANVPSSYWGRPVNVVHVDGVIPGAALQQLENEIMSYTGLPAVESLGQPSVGPASTLRFTQLLVAWPALGRISGLLREWATAPRSAGQPS
ncbi:phosphoribulokinase [Alkalilimnicola sp. S0819]|uniref:phosphoribulokinase n=1 Tax=Alkalilimnicola sp. S0819 TaxID=2613922 RepID=UPI001262593B|nr:phosphoribulokinase [Alkalilimnicola sp. S0819]KAB7627647.1 phosphoribulokinase [Alkalilimnicola sp. S0819]MPQ15813.1 phosphoribulokinase [Alkalilimnicola sp. S0819]